MKPKLEQSTWAWQPEITPGQVRQVNDARLTRAKPLCAAAVSLHSPNSYLPVIIHKPPQCFDAVRLSLVAAAAAAATVDSIANVQWASLKC